MSTVATERDQINGTAGNFPVLPEMALVEAELDTVLKEATGTVGKMCNELLAAGGKRIRPMLVLASGMLSGSFSSALIKAAASAELIHMASLVHDDIIDGAVLRRKKPSVNSKWGNLHAVLCGDYLFAKAFEILASNRLLQSMDEMVCAIKGMCGAEILQSEGLFKVNTTVEEYYKRIKGKTALFLECCCRSGAYSAGAEISEAEWLGEFGLHLGYAFQIMDDILDFTGNPEIIGKPVHEDLERGVITLPVIYLLQEEKYRDDIKRMIRKDGMTPEMISDIIDLLIYGGFINKSRDTMKWHIQRALHCLNGFRKAYPAGILVGLAERIEASIS